MSASAENMDTNLVTQDHILVSKELFVGLLDNTRELIGTQQWRKGTTQSNDRELDALEQEVIQAEQVIQNQPDYSDRSIFRPAETYDALLRQARSLDTLERSTRKALQYYQQRDYAQEQEKLRLSQESLNSEREANQRLTVDVERLEAELERQTPIIVRRHMDEIDADREADKWFCAVAKEYTDRPVRIERYGLTYNCEQPTEGRVYNLWIGANLVAQAVLVRDEANWTVLIMCKAI